LHEAGIISTSTRTTGYPDTEKLAHNPNFKFTGNMVETDGHIITAIGMGQAAAFAFAIAKALGISQAQIDELSRNTFITAI
jgi:putative intracellular protease/amidase